MPKVLEILQDKFPELDVTTSTQFSPYLAEALSKGQMDAALLRREQGWPNLEYETLLKTPLGVYMPKDHRLAAFQEISPQDLIGEPFLTVAKTAPVLRRAIDDYLIRCKVSIGTIHEIDHPAKAMSSIASNGCMAILPPYLQNYLSDSVTWRPLEGDPPTIDLVFGCNRSNESPVLKFLLSRLSELVERVTKQDASELLKPASEGHELSRNAATANAVGGPSAS